MLKVAVVVLFKCTQTSTSLCCKFGINQAPQQTRTIIWLIYCILD